MTSVEGILHAAYKAGCDVSITRGGLDQFMKGVTKVLTPKHREPLEQFVFRSRLGRALRNPKRASGYDRLLEVLSSGSYSKPNDLEVTGPYFFYHGSYIRKHHFLVRVLDIRAVDENALEATHSLRDNKSVHFPIIEAHGCVTFFGDLPHFLFGTDANRIGLHLMVATEAWRSKNQLTGFVGQMSGMNKGNAFHRHCLVVRGTEGLRDGEPGGHRPPAQKIPSQDPRTRMIQETGLFTLDELKGRHRKAIDKLVEIIPTPLFEDPIFNHPEHIKRSREPNPRGRAFDVMGLMRLSATPIQRMRSSQASSGTHTAGFAATLPRAPPIAASIMVFRDLPAALIMVGSGLSWSWASIVAI